MISSSVVMISRKNGRVVWVMYRMFLLVRVWIMNRLKLIGGVIWVIFIISMMKMLN